MHPLSDFTHIDAIGVLAKAHIELKRDPESTLREIAEAKRTLLKAEEFQLSLTLKPKQFDFSCIDEG